MSNPDHTSKNSQVELALLGQANTTQMEAADISQDLDLIPGDASPKKELTRMHSDTNTLENHMNQIF